MIDVTKILSKEVYDVLCEIPLQRIETVSKYVDLEQNTKRWECQ